MTVVALASLDGYDHRAEPEPGTVCEYTYRPPLALCVACHALIDAELPGVGASRVWLHTGRLGRGR